MIRILLVEDHTIGRDGIKNLLLKEPDFVVAGEVVNEREALTKLENGLKASIVISDITQQGNNGIELTRIIRDKFPEIKVIILTITDGENHIQKAFSNNVKGYLLKSVSLSELVFAIRHVAAGNTYICSTLVEKMVEKNSGFYNNNQGVNSKVILSPREVEILKMVASGLTNSEIAEKTFTSKRTVEGHRQKLLNKTGTKNTASLMLYAIQNKYLN